MEKEVIISIRGMQQFEEEDQDSIELITAGRLSRAESGEYTLQYEESELTGLDGTSTRFLIQPRRVTLTREGQVNSQMVFEVGRKHLSLYDTPYGSMEVGVSARKVRRLPSSRVSPLRALRTEPERIRPKRSTWMCSGGRRAAAR